MTLFRPMRLAERSFVVSNWSSSLRLSDRAGMISMETWADVMHPQINKILDRAHAITVVAVDEATDILQGFICADLEPGLGKPPVIPPGLPIVFYVCVIQSSRRSGVARGLFRSIGVDPLKPFTFACRTRMVGLLAHKIPHASHDHLRARMPETTRGAIT